MKVIRTILLIVIASVDLCHSQSVENSIILINTGPHYDKGRIAKEIAIINTLNPKVISLDIAFPEYTGNFDDKQLYKALRDAKKLVLPSDIRSHGEDYYGKEMITVALTCAAEFFVPYARTGFVTTIGKKNEILPRQFIVWQEGYTGDIYYHFSIVTVLAFDSLKASNFIQSHDRLVDVDYKSGIRKFKTFSSSDVLNGKLSKKDIEGKIVMMGFLGPGDEDKFSTPIGEMYGLEYLANIVSQILESK